MTNLTVSQFNTQKNQTNFAKKRNGFDESVIYAEDKIHALPAKGRLVKSSILTAPIRFIKDTSDDVVSLKKAVVDGDSNDYKLGRINDLALKLGSLGIAAYLFTKRPTTSNKLMEFVGFGSFFASMALWPKLFIQAPAKAIHGIDVFQEYDDSQGRRKKFFQDPQYIPWDILTSKEMDKLGDKLNIPKDIENRSDLTKEKAHKIALQSNTMWMLSAGLGVPIMSAFICSGIEKLLPKFLNEHKLNSSNAQFANVLNQKLDNIKPNQEIIDNFNKFTKNINSGTVVDDKFLRNLAEVTAPNSQYTEFVYDNLKSALKPSISNETIEKMFKMYQDDFEFLGVDKKQFMENFEQFKDQPIEIQQKGLILSLQNSNKNGRQIRDKFEFVIDFIENNKSATELPKETIEKARQLNQLFAKMQTVSGVISENLSLKSANSADAIATELWQKFSNAMVKDMNLSSKELQTFINSDDSAIEILDKNLTNAFKNNSTYDKRFNSLLSVFSEFSQKFNLQIVEKDGFKVDSKVPMIEGMGKDKEQIKKFYTTLSESFKALGLDEIANRLNNENISEMNTLINKNIDESTRGKFSAFSRSLLTLDFFKRKADGTLEKQISDIALRINGESISDETAKAFAKKAQNILLKGELTDFISKFNTNGDGNLDYKVIMNLLYNQENLSESTKNILIKNGEYTKEGKLFSTFMQNMYDTVGNLRNQHFPNAHTDAISLEDLSRNGNIKIRPNTYHSLIGDTFPSMLRKTYNNISNTNAWTKKFAILGGTVAGITILSQFFFGHLKHEKQNKIIQESEVA